MISSLNGILRSRAPESLIVDVNGVGYKVLVSSHTYSRLPALGEKVFVFIHTAVREDDISLYGFMDEQEQKVFQKLISVNGIGPKLALTILSGILPNELIQAIHRGDIARLTAISGIGKKTAERMILDLKEKMILLLSEEQKLSTPEFANKKISEDAVSALINLGYTRSTAETTLTRISVEEGAPIEIVIRQALKMLSEAR